MAAQNLHEKFGSKIPFAEPAWYVGNRCCVLCVVYNTPRTIAATAHVFARATIMPRVDAQRSRARRASTRATLLTS